MKIKLSSNNIPWYLIKAGILQKYEKKTIEINHQSSYGSNNLIIFNLNIINDHKLLVKQDRHHYNKEKANIIDRESFFHIFCQSSPDLKYIASLIFDIYYFDQCNSILVYRIPENYINLKAYYKNSKIFSTATAKLVGTTLATLHQKTSTSSSCRSFINQLVEGEPIYQFSHPSHLLDRLTPESIFKELPPEGNRFIAFYQSSESLRMKVEELVVSHNRYCLTHNYLKLNNILVNSQSKAELSSIESSEKRIIKFINWQKCSWGDPAFDLGTVIASYLLLWAETLIVHPAIELEKSLQLATTPLKVIQPLIVALTCSYINSYPEIIEDFPDFVDRVVQFTGLGLIYKIIETIQSFKGFDNSEICILQLSKSLICQPEKSFVSVFGMTKLDFNKLIYSSQVNTEFALK